MATRIPPLHVAELALKEILENIGLTPIVLNNWKINIEANLASWRYEITLSWRTYRLRHHIDKNDMDASGTSQLLAAGRFIASQLYVFNTAEDEEHMEAIALMARRPTNVRNQ